MAAFGSMYTAASGLQAFGQGMSVIGNNISNVSTTGYKRDSVHFADVMNDAVVTGSGVAEVGKGVQLSDVLVDFSPGSLGPGSESTDLALGGNGFFVLSSGEENDYAYTRSGAFRFDEQGYLKDPGGGVVQGYAIDTHRDPSVVAQAGAVDQSVQETIDFSSMTDVRLTSNTGQESGFVSLPERTTRVEMMVNLDSQAVNAADGQPASTSPAFAMFSAWDAGNETPLASGSYTYSTPLTVYDQAGTAHTVEAYFDPVYSHADADVLGGTRMWEYVVATDPAEDGRPAAQGSGKAGVLMTGTLTFSGSGELVNQSAFTPAPESGLGDLAHWTQADVSEQGHFLLTPQFAGGDGSGGNIGIDFGVADRMPQPADPNVTAADISTDPTTALQQLNMFNDSERLANASTSFDAGSATLYRDQNGYPEGILQSVSVDRDGVLNAQYSNGQIRNLFALAVADCPNRFGLHREGGNLFSETPGCGGMLFGLAGGGNERFGIEGTGLGGIEPIASQSLEQSNVDMATEFVDMIMTQKGFQANSKVVSTSDEILKMINQMKR
ncbi:flagellar hook protein FlgE [Desulfoplanes sp.]